MKVTLTDPDADKKRRAPGEVLGLAEKYGSASPRGNSYYSQALKCSREHALSSLVRLRPERDEDALTTGWLFHMGLEIWGGVLMQVQHTRGLEWARSQPGGVDEQTRQLAEDTAYQTFANLASEPGYEETFPTVMRCLKSYFEKARAQRYFYLAVEETLQTTLPIEYSARLDAIVVDMGETPAHDVTRAVEYKTARALAANLLAGYQLNLQTLGQAWLFGRCVDTSRYPRFAGVRVDITSKTKVPQHIEVDVIPTRSGMKAFESAVGSYQRLLDAAEREGFPPNFTCCAGATRAFRQCKYYNLCFNNPDLQIKDLLAEQVPPYGFVREAVSITEDEE